MNVRRILPAVGLLVALASSPAPAGPAAIPPHPLIIAAEALYQRGLFEPCDDLLKRASIAPDLTDDDFVRLQFVAALRHIDENNELAARRALAQALQVDRKAEPPSFAAPKLGPVLKEVRAGLSSEPAIAQKIARAREPGPGALLKVVDAWYSRLWIDGALILLDLARSSTPLTTSDRVQVALRQGVFRMETLDEKAARAEFREALEVDPDALLPPYAPPKTRLLFDQLKRERTTATAPAKPTVAFKPIFPQSVPAPVVLWSLGGLGLATGGILQIVAAREATQAWSLHDAGGPQSEIVAKNQLVRVLQGVGYASIGIGAAGLIGGFLAKSLLTTPSTTFATDGKTSVFVISGSFGGP